MFFFCCFFVMYIYIYISRWEVCFFKGLFLCFCFYNSQLEVTFLYVLFGFFGELGWLVVAQNFGATILSRMLDPWGDIFFSRMFNSQSDGLTKRQWFGARWFGIRIGVSPSNSPFIFGDPRNPNHRAPNHQPKPPHNR